MRGEEPRSINRHTYTEAEIAETVQKPMLKDMYDLMRFRNTHPAFNGAVQIGEDHADGKLTITWVNGADNAKLEADFTTMQFRITCSGDGAEREVYAQEGK